MTIRTSNEETPNTAGAQPAVVNPPVTPQTNGVSSATPDLPNARNDSVVEEQVMRSPAGGWDLTRGWVRSLGGVIMASLAIVETLLVFRFGFLLSGANADNGFVNFIYDISKPLASPFQGIIADSGNLEFASPIAMAVYAVAALLLIAVLFAVTSGPSAAGEKVTTSRSQRSERVR